MIRRFAFSAIGVALAVAVVRAQQTPAFRVERPIIVDGAGPRRLAVDVPLLAGSAPFKTSALSDLRLYDANGREVGYLLVSNPPTAPRFKAAAILPIAPVDTDTVRTSGFEADLRDATLVDAIRLEGLPPPFLKRVRLEGSGDREHWTLLVDDGTIFDLPPEQLRLTELRFRPGPYRYLRLTFDDRNSARLPHPLAALARLVVGAAPPPALTAAVAFERRASEPGVSRFRIHLPAGRLPIVALDLDVAGNYVFRQARVFEARFAGGELVPVQLGASRLRRVVQNDAAASSLRVPIESPSEAQLEVEVDDGDNPPLDLKGVTAVFAELPWIYFESSGGTLTARYGNDTLKRPRYDIEALRNQVRIESVADARWGEPRARSAEENAAAGVAPPLPTLGAPLDASLFKYLRDLPSGSAGLIAVPLDVAVIAHSAGPAAGFADLRAIDASGSQIPYVLERTSEPLTLDLTPERLTTPPKTLPARPPAAAPQSIYRVKYAYAELPATKLTLSTTARVFDRGVTVAVERPPDQHRRDAWLQVIASTRWVHADQERPAPPLTFQLPAIFTTDVLVIVDEGDNSPLPIGAAHVVLPATRIRLFREEGKTIRLAYGRTDLTRPRYDLALLAPQVIGTAAQEVVAGPERASGGNQSTAALVSPRLFWIALGASVLVLLMLIVRLLQKPA
ncbi:MAG TPA: DUF3999 family protein [Vicinamibacterales bacterium]